MTEYIYQKELANGVPGLPKIPKDVQANARKNGWLEFIKIGRHIVYRRANVERYLENLENNNIRKAKTSQEDN